MRLISRRQASLQFGVKVGHSILYYVHFVLEFLNSSNSFFFEIGRELKVGNEAEDVDGTVRLSSYKEVMSVGGDGFDVVVDLRDWDWGWGLGFAGYSRVKLEKGKGKEEEYTNNNNNSNN
eukprot:CAMPEP_0201519128 /NCGR_PEP_ID=MMETSP0161_2-20130828/9766_1 /ASSEMBLY_ACC=CAM_ASM_000251 /TAXON_ID=180227 /ORGANISM="Neoparamoeba aestuarina, Strain SoJaBio B1-5/56/2" /LENGTH=119 /DNA_ID=CAMNT_0047917075 /DNA_START=60 /DNA_END=416 /DNA_ORIENTATION=+